MIKRAFKLDQMNKLIPCQFAALTLLLLNTNVLAQHDGFCRALQAAITSEVFYTHIINSTNKHERWILVDTSLKSNLCPLVLINDSPVAVLPQFPDSIRICPIKPSSFTNNSYKNYIVIYNIQLVRSKMAWSISFWKPLENANLVLEVGKKNRKIRVVSRGVF